MVSRLAIGRDLLVTLIGSVLAEAVAGRELRSKNILRTHGKYGLMPRQAMARVKCAENPIEALIVVGSEADFLREFALDIIVREDDRISQRWNSEDCDEKRLKGEACVNGLEDVVSIPAG